MNTTMPPIVTLLNEDGPGPRDVLVVEETVLPMLLMPDVPVVLRDVREPISILQRFLLQAAVDAGPLDLREAHQATAIPIVALRRVAGEFARAGLFVADEQPDRFSARDELCRRSLAADRVELEKPGRLHFLFLPESDEVVALHMDGQTRKFVTALQACVPEAGFPTPSLEGRGLAEFLQSHLDHSAVGGLPSDFIRTEQPGIEPAPLSDGVVSPMPKAVPVFRVAFTVTAEKDRTRCRLKLLAPRKPVDVDLSAAQGMAAIATERATVSSLPTSSVPALTDLGMPHGSGAELHFESPVRATVPLDSWNAQQVAAQVWLTQKHPVRVHQPSLAMTTRAAVSFLSADEGADRLFAVDEAAQALLTAATPPTPKTLEEAVTRTGRDVHRNDVTDRLWRCRQYACVHAIRVQEDLFHA